MDNIKIRIPLTVSQRQQTIPLGVQAGGGGTRNYNALANKPAINGHELVGDQTAAELGLATPEDIPTVPTKTSDLANDSGFVNAAGAAAAAPVKSVNGQTGVVTLDAEDVGALPDSSTLDNIPDGATYKRPTAAQLQQIQTNAADIQTQGGEIDQLQADVDAIEQKIPNQASSTNQLADKDFVNSSINSAAAFFRGAFPTRAALFAVAWQTTDPAAANYVSNNDYAYVADDETHNDEAWRYIYVLQPGGTDNGWQAQFRVNESPLTAAQLAALNSGATAALIEQISANAAAIARKQAIINASGILKGSGNGQVSAAAAGTDYQTPLTAGTDYLVPSALSPYRTAAAQDVIDAAQDEEIDALHEGKAPVIIDTASGAIASFEDGAGELPLKTLVVNIEPMQAGSGNPSPTNIRPISGWTGCNVTRAGKNLLDIDSVTSGAVDPDTGEVIPSTSVKITPLIKCEPNTTYVISGFVNKLRPHYYKSSVEYIGEASSITFDTFTTPADCYFMRLHGANSAWRNAVNPQLELGSTATGYEPYVVAVYSITFPAEAGTVYGGKLTINEDGSGELRKRPYYASYNGETLVGPWLSSMDVYAEDATPTIGAQVVDLGGEETVYQLTDLQVIDTLYGTNNIWADCGNVEVTYRADTKIYVDDHSGSGAVNDVQVNGTSIVQGGVANIPMASASTPGVVISGTVTVTGTTPTINAQPGVRYVCGEVTTLDITLPASGIVDVTFESGSVPTVLTITPPTGVTLKWANGFDPDNLAANTSYQIRVMDGEFGVADASGADSGSKSLGVIGAQVGDFVKVKAVDANGVPTAWEKASGLGTKVFEYELKDNWYKINVVSIDYETGVLTLEPNSALFTDDFTTTIRASIRPLIEGVTARFLYGNIPPELYYDTSFYAVSVGENQVQLYKNATTPISSLTNTGNVDLSRFQLWAEISRHRAIPDSEITGLLPNHHYRVRWVAPYGLHHFVAGPAFRRQDNSQYGSGYATGYAATTIRAATTNAAIGYFRMNNYETVSLRASYGWTTNNLYCCLPLSFECDLYRISEKSWRLDVKTMAMAFYGSPIKATTSPEAVPFNHHIYLNNAPYALKTNFNGNGNTAFDGCRMTVWDMGEEY